MSKDNAGGNRGRAMGVAGASLAAPTVFAKSVRDAGGGVQVILGEPRAPVENAGGGAQVILGEPRVPVDNAGGGAQVTLGEPRAPADNSLVA